MGRPLSKMNEEKLRTLIRLYPTTKLTVIAEELEVHHTTVLYWVKKLRKQGLRMEKSESFTTSESEELIRKVLED